MTMVEQHYRRDADSLSPAERLFVDCPDEDSQRDRLTEFLATIPPSVREAMPWSWRWWARPTQLAPDTNWRTWVVRAGRGFGKTRTGAEETRRRVRKGLAGHISLIGATAADVRDVMVEGESGLLAVHPPGQAPEYEPSKRRLTWPNGATATCFSAEEPDRLRGPQSDWVWGDEPASWRSGVLAWDNAMFGHRLGADPRSMLTMTPRPLSWLKAIEAEQRTHVTNGSTYDNLTNLAESFIDMVLGRYEGTRLGRQELHALYLDDVEGALWQMATIEATRIARFDIFDPWRSLHVELNRVRLSLGLGIQPLADQRTPWRTVVGVDPPGETAECGIVVGAAPAHGKAGQHHAVIIDDMSLVGTPEIWGAQVVAAVHKHHAERVVVESNQGGDMVRSTIHNVDPDVTVTKVRASQSKYDRAEPISVLYSKGWVHHAGFFGDLETQLTTWVPTESKSPDRLDALVHLVNGLLTPMPSVRATAHSPVGRRIA